MDTEAFQILLTDFDATTDSLESALTPLISQPLSTLTTKLPLLERAKLYTLTTYAILSLLFSSLKLDGVDAKDHPVFTELTRCRQQFEKIKEAESAHERKSGADERRLRVDKEAVARFVRAGVGNVGAALKIDVEKKEPERKAPKRKRKETENGTKQQETSKDAPQSEREANDDIAEKGNKNERKGSKKDGKKRRRQKETPKSSSQAIQALLKKSEGKRSTRRRNKDAPSNT